MLKTILLKIQKFNKADKGAVLIFLGLSILPLLLIVGLATDTGYGLIQKRKLQMGVDAAAKAGAKYGNNTLATVTSIGTTLFAANTVNMTGITGPNITLDSTTGCVSASASINVPTTFMVLGGITSVNYSATSSSCPYGAAGELALLIDLSTTTGNWTSKALNSMSNLINGLPASTVVTVIPFASNIYLDATTTVPGNLFANLSNTANDESAFPAFYGLSSNYTWNSTNYGNVYNYLYGSTFPTVTSYYPSPGTCTGWGGPGTYLACATLYPGLCSVGHTSCNSNYKYNALSVPAILSPTTNRTTILNYVNALVPTNDPDTFPSLIVWGWRALDPNWKSFWLTNIDSATTVRGAGKYPLAYKTYNPKNVILYTSGTTAYTPSSQSNWYSSACSTGNLSYNRNYYGVLPITTDRASSVDITCNNYHYKTIDQALGLNLTTNNYYASGNNFTSYGATIQAELNNKFLRTCTNMKALGINIYIVTQNDSSILQQCASGTGLPYYQVTGNGVPSVNIAATNVTSTVGGPVATQG